MLFLKEIFAYAVSLGIFDPKTCHNEIPSPWPWENEIFRTGGTADDEDLLRLFAEHKAAQQLARDEAEKQQRAAQEAAEPMVVEEAQASDNSASLRDAGDEEIPMPP